MSRKVSMFCFDVFIVCISDCALGMAAWAIRKTFAVSRLAPSTEITCSLQSLTWQSNLQCEIFNPVGWQSHIQHCTLDFKLWGIQGVRFQKHPRPYASIVMHIPCAGSDQLPSTFCSPLTQRPTTQPPPPPSVGLRGKGPHAQLLVCKNSCVLHKRVGYLQTGPLCCHIVSYRKLIHYSAAPSRINGHLRETWSKVFSSLAVSCQLPVQKVQCEPPSLTCF